MKSDESTSNEPNELFRGVDRAKVVERLRASQEKALAALATTAREWGRQFAKYRAAATEIECIVAEEEPLIGWEWDWLYSGVESFESFAEDLRQSEPQEFDHAVRHPGVAVAAFVDSVRDIWNDIEEDV